MRKIIIILLCVAAAGLGIYYLQSDQTDTSSGSNKFSSQDKILPTDTVVKITDAGFVPDNITIKKGTAVVWLNLTNNFVWTASDPHPTHTIYPQFDPQEPYKNGETWAFVFDRAGDWGYHDHLKPSSKGTVHVTE